MLDSLGCCVGAAMSAPQKRFRLTEPSATAMSNDWTSTASSSSTAVPPLRRWLMTRTLSAVSVGLLTVGLGAENANRMDDRHEAHWHGVMAPVYLALGLVILLAAADLVRSHWAGVRGGSRSLAWAATSLGALDLLVIACGSLLVGASAILLAERLNEESDMLENDIDIDAADQHEPAWTICMWPLNALLGSLALLAVVSSVWNALASQSGRLGSCFCITCGCTHGVPCDQTPSGDAPTTSAADAETYLAASLGAVLSRSNRTASSGIPAMLTMTSTLEAPPGQTGRRPSIVCRISRMMRLALLVSGAVSSALFTRYLELPNRHSASQALGPFVFVLVNLLVFELLVSLVRCCRCVGDDTADDSASGADDDNRPRAPIENILNAMGWLVGVGLVGSLWLAVARLDGVLGASSCDWHCVASPVYASFGLYVLAAGCAFALFPAPNDSGPFASATTTTTANG